MKILHTSDWHLGKELYRSDRSKEFESFLTWLNETIVREKIDVLLIAGDIFDTYMPTNAARRLYYRFLASMQNTPCRHIVITSGNHDSSAVLDAPSELLRYLDIDVIGSARTPARDEVLVLKDRCGQPELIVCAVPFLRESDVRQSKAGESAEDKANNLRSGIVEHYLETAGYAENLRKQFGGDLPVAAMGHLYAAGGRMSESENRIVGTLDGVDLSAFPESFDYVALGHLHVPQTVGHSERIRYSGSPIPMSFGEAGQKKIVCIVDFNGRTPHITTLDIPEFRLLRSISGDLDDILRGLDACLADGRPMWIEVVYKGEQTVLDLGSVVDNKIKDTNVTCLRITNDAFIRKYREGQALQKGEISELRELDEHDVFERLLNDENIPDEERVDLRSDYEEILEAVRLCMNTGNGAAADSTAGTDHRNNTPLS